MDLAKVILLDSAAAIFIYNLEKKLHSENIKSEILCDDKDVLSMLALVKLQKSRYDKRAEPKKQEVLERLGRVVYTKHMLFLQFIAFLIGVVVAYQSAYQLKIYGANIFIVDMLGISILRELAPLITAIVIAGGMIIASIDLGISATVF